MNSLNTTNHILERRYHHTQQNEAETEMYTLEDLPRVTALNDSEVQSIDSALLSAEEQDLIDTSSSAVELDHHRYSKSPGYMQHKSSRQTSAMRRVGHSGDVHDRSLERRINVVTPDPNASTPSTLRRNVSAFGEITVMPVGDNEDDELRVAVEEQLRH